MSDYLPAWAKGDRSSLRAEITAVAVRLEALAVHLDTLAAASKEHGRRLDGVPAAVVVEIRLAADQAKAIAIAAFRRRLWDEVGKWAWRAAIVWTFGKLALSWDAVLEGFHAVSGGV